MLSPSGLRFMKASLIASQEKEYHEKCCRKQKFFEIHRIHFKFVFFGWNQNVLDIFMNRDQRAGFDIFMTFHPVLNILWSVLPMETTALRQR